MHWKRYKELPLSEKRQETYYIVGLDLGNDSSAIAFYNFADNKPEIIDLSGGYGRPTIPTVMQFISESKEWVFGEYAIQNLGVGKEITLYNLTERLGNHEYIDIDNKPVSISYIFGLYIKELMSNVKNINPKAEIAGIAVSVPSYLSNRAKEELQRAFKSAGYAKELICLISDRECLFSYIFRDGITTGQKVFLIDYGAREVRGGVYTADGSGRFKSLSSLFEDTIGTGAAENKVFELFSSYYTANNPIQSRSGLTETDKALKGQLTAFTYQHKNLLFQKSIRNKSAKLYFNFAFPPFQQVIGEKDANKIIEPFRRRFDKFILHVLENSIEQKDEKVTAADIDVVICSGGGFEMLWAKEAVTSLFPQSKLRVFKNSKAITAESAAYAAAQALGAAEGITAAVEDRHQLPVDIGLILRDGKDNKENFIPLAEYNSFWWQNHPGRYFILNESVHEDIPFKIWSRTPEGYTKILSDTVIKGLPKRPKGTTRLKVQLKFSSDNEAAASVRDCGFGEMYPKTDFEQEIVVKL